MWKGCAFANAARNGVFAALLAAEGMTGPAPIFEGSLGFMKVLIGPFELPLLGGEPIRARKVSRPDGGPAESSTHHAPRTTHHAPNFMITKTYIKFWPAEYHSQSAIDAALQLRPEIGDIRNISAIDIHTFDAAVDIIANEPEKWRPSTRETADHSLPYCTAVALVDGDVTLAQFDPKRFTDPALLELVARIKVHRDPALTSRYPNGIPSRLTVALNNGRTLMKEVEFPRGHAHNPMTDAEVEKKFRVLVEPRYGKEKADRILSVCWGLEKLRQSSDLIGLFAL
jgi:2-methylcitrate dehydratase